MARNYKREYANYQGKPEQIKRRSQRNTARRKAEKAGKVHKGVGKDVHHVTHNTASSKVRVISASANRADGGRIGDKKGKARGGRKGGKKNAK